MKTKDKLAAALREVAANVRSAHPANADKYEAFAKRAETGEFDDFADVHVCGPTQLYSELMQAGFKIFAKRVANGEFDATREESEAWANSPSGQDALGRLSPAVRQIITGKMH